MSANGPDLARERLTVLASRLGVRRAPVRIPAPEGRLKQQVKLSFLTNMLEDVMHHLASCNRAAPLRSGAVYCRLAYARHVFEPVSSGTPRERHDFRR